MASVKHFINESINKVEVDEFLWNEFERAGYGGVEIARTPLGTNIIIYAMRPGIVIGRGGVTIKNLAKVLEENFDLSNPQISVAEIEIPELNANVMASRVASSLRRGTHYRRVGFWALNQIIESGAQGAEITISGKLRTDRSRFEKFREGYVPKSGEPAAKFVRKSVVHVQLKPGILGIRVSIMPSDAQLPDKVEIFEDTEQKPSIPEVSLSDEQSSPKIEEAQEKIVSDLSEEEKIMKSSDQISLKNVEIEQEEHEKPLMNDENHSEKLLVDDKKEEG